MLPQRVLTSYRAGMGFFDWLLGSAVAAPFDPDEYERSSIASPWSNPDLLSHLTLAELWPDAATDETWITRKEAESVPAVQAAVHRIAGTLSRLPILATTAGGAPWGTPGSQQLALLEQPDPTEARATTFRKTLTDMVFDGGAYWAVTNSYATGSKDDAPQRPWSVVHVPIGQVTDGGGVDEGYQAWVMRHKGVRLALRPGTKPEDNRPWLIYFDGPGPGLCNRPRVVRAAINLERAFGHAADNPVPSIDLHQTTDDKLTPDEIQNLIQTWKAARRRGGVGYTNKAVEAKVLGLDQSQLLIDGRNQQAVEVARMVGIPAASIDAGIPGTSLTYANLTDRLHDLVNFGLQNYAIGITDRLSMVDILPRGVKSAYDYTALYPAAPAPKQQAAQPVKREEQTSV